MTGADEPQINASYEALIAAFQAYRRACPFPEGAGFMCVKYKRFQPKNYRFVNERKGGIKVWKRTQKLI